MSQIEKMVWPKKYTHLIIDNHPDTDPRMCLVHNIFDKANYLVY